ncbi:MAG: thiamine pyrophosphate-dependent enzyme [Chloroflexota bacterium]
MSAAFPTAANPYEPVPHQAQPHGANPETPACSPSINRLPDGACRETAVSDYQTAYLSRQVSIVARREVLQGRAKFGIFGAGKEVAQIAMARVFQLGDFRSGYYRDQTFAFASGLITPQQLFAQLYGHTDIEADPSSAGRMMVSHFASHFLDAEGNWLPQTERINSASDTSPTASQMPRLVGLAYASRLYRELAGLKELTQFSQNGNEVAFGTIGNGSCAEGFFWEAINAIGVLRSPAVISIWDDNYAISVTNRHQFAKHDLSKMLRGLRYNAETGRGYRLFRVRGWHYPELLDAYQKAVAEARRDHIPAIIHVVELTQPLGHSTSGSHERYKPEARLTWEKEFDPLPRMRAWLLEQGWATEDELAAIEEEAKAEASASRRAAWASFRALLDGERDELVGLLEKTAVSIPTHAQTLTQLATRLRQEKQVIRRTLQETAEQALRLTRRETTTARAALLNWQRTTKEQHHQTYGSHQTSESPRSPLRVPVVSATYGDQPQKARGFELIRKNFDATLQRDPRVVIFGEDVGRLGDVNQGLFELQEKYGRLRVSDTGIREATIVGQAIGLAQRGLRPIAEIQYLDYIMYAIAPLTDDLANLHWRTGGRQAAPVIIRTRGHRLEGVFHSGSQMGALIHLMRGMHLLVPRNMTQAAGFYNTLLRGDDPAILVEVLNGYRLSEPLPTNLGDFTVPLGVPEVLQAGSDVTLVTYGANCRIAQEAVAQLAELDISVELIDVQSLLPFDRHHRIAESVAKTNRLVVLDEDMPGGASAYILQQILEVQGAYWSLDSEPRTITAQPHRPAYTTDGDYFSKPNVEEIVRVVYGLMHESQPARYPAWF